MDLKYLLPSLIRYLFCFNQFEHVEKIDLLSLEPMIAMPSNTDNVKKVSVVESLPIYQAYVGSSANPSYRKFAIVSEVINTA